MTRKFFWQSLSKSREKPDLERCLRSRSNRIPLLSATLDTEDLAIARYWLRQADLGQSLSDTEQLEDRFSNWLGTGLARAFMGGRAALYALNRALGLKPGDGVIVPAFSCQCVANAFRYVGVQIQYADIELEGLGLDLESVKQQIQPNTRAIMIQHTFGLVGRDFLALLALAKEKQLLVIEDCAHALGGTFQGQLLGTFGDGAIYSSERSKIISTIHGGIAVAHAPEAQRRLNWLAQYSSLPSVEHIRMQLNSVQHDYYVHCHPYRQWTAPWAKRIYQDQILPQMWDEELGGSSLFRRYEERMPSCIAALMQHQLDKLPSILTQRRQTALLWQDICVRYGWQMIVPIQDSKPAWVRFPILVEDRAQKTEIERRLNVEVGVWFGSARHPLSFNYNGLPKASFAAKHVLNLPVYFV